MDDLVDTDDLWQRVQAGEGIPPHTVGALLELGEMDLVLQVAREQGDWFCAQAAAHELCEAGEFEWAWTVLLPFAEAGLPDALRTAADILLRWRRTDEELTPLHPGEMAQELDRAGRTLAQLLVQAGWAQDTIDSLLPDDNDQAHPSWRGGAGVPAVTDEGGKDFHAGTEEDVRFVMARMPAEVKDGFRYDAVPWRHFDGAPEPGTDVPGLLETMRSGEPEAADRALGTLWHNVCHQGCPTALGALTVPFLARIAARPGCHRRADVLHLMAALARRSHFGDSSRTGLLRAAASDTVIVIEASGYLANWAVQAAREALAADVDLLLPLLDDPDPEVRRAVTQALAAVPGGGTGHLSATLHARLATEHDPAARACLVLAIGQLAWEHRDLATIDLMLTWWQDPARPAEIRISAALAWLCLVDDPVPDDLNTLFDEAVTDDLVTLLDSIAWLYDADGLRRCIEVMSNPDDCPWPASAP
ncbi:HEAT repeat domain-containing protein [Kitasatospora sp. NBC_00240]|nr:HEAT repeat domain-containing protein [Kitasatospora sp. NBC_00240]